MKSAFSTLFWYRSLVVILAITLSITGPLRPPPTQADLALHAYIMSGGNADDLCVEGKKGHQHLNCALFCTVFPLTLGPAQPDWHSSSVHQITTVIWPPIDPFTAHHHRRTAQARAPPTSV